MSTATTKNVLQGLVGTNYRCIPQRTPGTLGHRDAADPNIPMCLPGDSQGPIGFGDDAASIASMVFLADDLAEAWMDFSKVLEQTP